MLLNWKIPALTIATACVLIAIYTVYNQHNKSSQTNTKNTIKKQTKMTDSDNKSDGGTSLGLLVNSSGNNNQNLCALSSATKMDTKKNKIPRGATGTMPGKSLNNSNRPKTITGFREKPKSNETQPNIDQKDNNNPEAGK